MSKFTNQRIKPFASCPSPSINLLHSILQVPSITFILGGWELHFVCVSFQLHKLSHLPQLLTLQQILDSALLTSFGEFVLESTHMMVPIVLWQVIHSEAKYSRCCCKGIDDSFAVSWDSGGILDRRLSLLEFFEIECVLMILWLLGEVDGRWSLAGIFVDPSVWDTLGNVLERKSFLINPIADVDT